MVPCGLLQGNLVTPDPPLNVRHHREQVIGTSASVRNGALLTCLWRTYVESVRDPCPGQEFEPRQSRSYPGFHAKPCGSANASSTSCGLIRMSSQADGSQTPRSRARLSASSGESPRTRSVIASQPSMGSPPDTNKTPVPANDRCLRQSLTDGTEPSSSVVASSERNAGSPTQRT